MKLEVYNALGAKKLADGQTLATNLLVPWSTATIAWAAQPAALTEYRGSTAQRRIMDLRYYTEVRFSAYCGALAGFAGASFRLLYSVNAGGAWAYFDSTGANSGPSVAVDGVAGTPVQGSWVTMDAAARINGVWVSLWGINGNGAANVQPGMIEVEFRP